MSTRLARQSLDLLNSFNKKEQEVKKEKVKLKLPKTNKGIKKVKHEIRYKQHTKRRLLAKEKENPLDLLKQEEISAEEKLRRNVQIMQKALRSSELEKVIHKEIIQERAALKGKRWTSKVNGSDGDTDEDED
ncbi:hypothetical protein BDB01DRAFT_806530 [Pilobolus umbonatus]|nr:hypothetical protein BDB01DRAFT_806530 [Pilobolus umbonatus]